MSRWALWRKRPPAAHPMQAQAATSPRRPASLYVPLEALQVVLAWLLPSSAVVVAALGQFMLALVLLAVAWGVWLRLWRSRKKRQATVQAPR